jgi:hypothetical protein
VLTALAYTCVSSESRTVEVEAGMAACRSLRNKFYSTNMAISSLNTKMSLCRAGRSLGDEVGQDESGDEVWSNLLYTFR